MKTNKMITKPLLSPDNDPSMAQPPNWKNQTVLIGDNVDIMRAMNSQTANLIATDPPFNKHKKFDHIFGGKKEFGFDDAWTLHAERNEEHKLLESDHNDLYEVCKIGGKLHSKGMLGYLVFMGVRLIECKRILKETGSIYLHCDHSANAYLRMLMNGVFGEQNFRNEIAWWYKKWTNTGKIFQHNHDTILFYTKSENYTFNKLFGGLTKDQIRIRKTGYNAGRQGGKKILRVYDREKASAKIALAKKEGRTVYYIDEPHKGSPIPSVWEMPIIGGKRTVWLGDSETCCVVFTDDIGKHQSGRRRL